jgi:hypothetical protein
MSDTEESAKEPTQDVPVDINATLLAELRASRLASEKLARDFASFQTDTSAKIANLERQNATLRKDADEEPDDLVYVSHDRNENPFPQRPQNCTVKPQPFDLYGDRTADRLEDKQNSSLKWEYRTLAPALSYFFDAKAVYDGVREDIIGKLEEDESLAIEGIFNSLDGVYAMLTARYATIKIRTRCESEPGGLSEENKLLLEYLDTKLHGVFPGEAIVDSQMEGWLKEYRDKRASAELKNAASAGAKTMQSRSSEAAPKAEHKVRFETRDKAKKQGVKPKSSAK